MKAWLNTGINASAAVICYWTGYPALFWLAVAVTGTAASFIVAEPHNRRYRQTVRDMEQAGCSVKEIEEFMDKPVEYTEFDYNIVPTWIPMLGTLALLVGKLLFVAGIIILLKS